MCLAVWKRAAIVLSSCPPSCHSELWTGAQRPSLSYTLETQLASGLALTNEMRPVGRQASPETNGQSLMPSQDFPVPTRTGLALVSDAGVHQIGTASGSLLAPCAQLPLNLDVGSLGTLAAGQRHLADAWKLERIQGLPPRTDRFLQQ